MKILLRTLITSLAAAVFAAAVFAAKPVLSVPDADGLPKTMRASTVQTLRLQFSDADGDKVKKAVLVDQSPSGKVETAATRIGGGNTADGITLEWTINGFEQGAHQAYFEVTGTDGNTVRYPEPDTEFYTFVAESLPVKIGIFAAGAVVGLAFLPFLVYVLARAINRRGDPARAARVGLLIGILACAALFIYLFASFYGPLAYAIGIIAGLALLILVLTRR